MVKWHNHTLGIVVCRAIAMAYGLQQSFGKSTGAERNNVEGKNLFISK